LKWIFERCRGTVGARETAVGRLPESLDTSGLAIPPAALETLLSVDVKGWLEDIPSIREHFKTFGDRLPRGLAEELSSLAERLATSK
jgi:phosphoenolpyruvate carboxykinase (GTP)